jgi:predicted Rossmann fold nucleotide-binding protein DprA/Smf involved in DNA uptake
MTTGLSTNTQAILLLTAPLIAGKSASSPDLLKPSEYKRLACHLRELQRQPADFLSPDTTELFRDCGSVIDAERLRRLLDRGFLLSQVVEHWQTRAIWVVSRADADYPRRLKARLREDAPAVIYGCGDRRLLDTGGLAVVGSRHVDEAMIDFTMRIGQLCAKSGRTLISGGAKGIDLAAMRGTLEAGGKVSGIMADSLERTAMNREHRNLLLDGQLVLISPYDPAAGFNVGNAMQRNKLIYALADAALVVESDFNKGGTWAGAVEQLDKLRLVPVFVRSTGELGKGLPALMEKGALAWPNPVDVDDFNAVFDAKATCSVSEQLDLFQS